MKFFKILPCLLLFSFFINGVMANHRVNTVPNDTISLAQAYMNLYLTSIYYDSIDADRISKILAFEKDEMDQIKNRTFIRTFQPLHSFTQSIWYQTQAKRLYFNDSKPDRNTLRRYKSVLDRGINFYNAAKLDEYPSYSMQQLSFYEIINFDLDAADDIRSEIYKVKTQYNSLFNENIYPDFQRIFLKAKERNRIELDSLTFYAGLFEIPLSMSTLNNTIDFPNAPSFKSYSINPDYRLENRLELISRYLQLKFLATQRTRPPANFNTETLYHHYDEFMEMLRFEEDEFIKKELTPEVTALLFRQLKRRYPSRRSEGIRDESLAAISAPNPAPNIMYFFPNPAPKSSTHQIIKNFKPDLQTLNQVDLFFRSKMQEAGFGSNHLHYYYDMDGYAMTTSLEKFNKDGTKVSSDKRFTESMGEDGKFSYFEIFKSIFFEVESEFRMFAFVVASKPATLGGNIMTTSFAEEILQNSYPTLPNDLKVKTLPTKDLTILVYHFHQNDIGQVPELDLSGSWEVQDHLRSAGIPALN
ncbi:hypothetical protein [Algoriphagus halophilus]|uniref:Uncharacterized protein n=1 Tax=Algoriphagus halophilus TaxID=226505 RepID=A0A1N6DB72_9BACT|nr:hypothetical protein [Algoriphagus halophilus]SIN68020.1 hypothetical protein SAMN05444394_0638 [Algoriphagus halophilus]